MRIANQVVKSAAALLPLYFPFATLSLSTIRLMRPRQPIESNIPQLLRQLQLFGRFPALACLLC
ncbi:MAG: hypothetical protein V9G20_18200 [Candidatus Promineifilaceae bacterium]